MGVEGSCREHFVCRTLSDYMATLWVAMGIVSILQMRINEA